MMFDLKFAFKKLCKFAKTIMFLGLMFTSANIFASPLNITYQARIVKPNGYPLQDPGIHFRFTILDPSEACVLYSENYSSINMQNSGGLISFSLGSGVPVFNASGTIAFSDVFDNASANLPCSDSSTYSPNSNDVRKIVMQFMDASGWQTLPAMAINAVPYAIYSFDAQRLGGVSAGAFVRTSTIPTCTASEAITYTNASFSCIGAGSLSSITSTDITNALGYTPIDESVVQTSFTTVVATVNDLASSQTIITSTVNNLAASYTVLASTVGDLATSFSTVVSSQWVTSGSMISYLGGNVGIGTSNPYGVLDVASDTPTQRLKGNLNAPNFYLYNQNNGINLTTNQSVGFISFGGYYNNTDDSSLEIASIISDYTGSGVERSGRLRFRTFNSGTAVTAMTMSASGNIGIGTTSPSAKLSIIGNGTTSTTRLVNFADSSGLSKFAILDDGNIGIGTTVPTAKLHITAGSSTQAPLKITSGTLLSSPQSGTIEYDGSQLYFTDGTNTRRALASTSTPGSFENTSSISNLSGNIILSPNNSTGSVVVSATTASTSADTGALVVKGGVGIGGDLVVSGSVKTGFNTNGIADGLFTNSQVSTAPMGYGFIGQGTAVDGLHMVSWGSAHVVLDSDNNDTSRYFSVSKDAKNVGTSSELFRITETGNVGIGTSSPAFALDVSGTIRYSGPLIPNYSSNTYTDAELNSKFGYTASTTSTFRQVQMLRDDTHISNISSIEGQHTSSMLFSNYDHGGHGTNGFFFGKIPFGGNYKNNGITLFTIRNTGNVGIGTINPSSRLDIANIGSNAISQKPRGISISTLDLGGSTGDAGLQLSTPYGAGTSLTTNLRNIRGTGSAYIGFELATTTNHPIRFLTNSTGENVNERMRISENGNVGIGTSTPALTLDVSGSIGLKTNATYIYGKNSTGTVGRMSGINQSNVLYFGDIDAIASSVIIQSNNSDLNHSALGSTSNIKFSTSGTERMRIDSNGNVGIGTTNPESSLQVNGSGIIIDSGSSAGYGSGIKFNNTTFNHFSAGVKGNKFVIAQTNTDGSLVWPATVTDRLTIDNVGNIGIGATNPIGKLHLENIANGTPAVMLKGNLIDGGQIFNFDFDRFNANDRFWKVNGSGVNGENIIWSSHVGTSSGTVDSYFYYGSEFQYSQQGNSRIFVSSSGNVGVGTSSPAYKFHVGSNTVSGSDGQIALSKNDGLGGTRTSVLKYDSNFDYGIFDQGVTEQLSVNYAAPANSFYINSVGNVGVGTANPEMKLDVRTSADSAVYLNIQHDRNHVGATNPKAGVRLENNSEASGGPNQAALIYIDSYQNNNAGNFYISNRAAGKKTYIQSTTIGSVNRDAIVIDSTGMVGIATSAPAQALDVVGNIQTSGCLYYASSSLGTCASDERIKKDVVGFDLGLEILLGINPVKFKYNGLAGFKDDGKVQLGVIAQDVERAAPELVKKRMVQLNENDKQKTEIKVVDYGAFTYVMINAIKDLYELFLGKKAEIEKLKNENASQKVEIENLQQRLDRLEKRLGEK